MDDITILSDNVDSPDFFSSSETLIKFNQKLSYDGKNALFRLS